MKMNQKQLEKALALIDTYKSHLPNKNKAKQAYIEMFENECPELREFVGMRVVDDPLTILSRKNLDGLSFTGRTFERIDFSRSSMRYVDMSNCLLSLCNLSSTDFEGADISESEILSCKISKTSFRRASLDHSIIKSDFDLMGGVKESTGVDFSYSTLVFARLENLFLAACDFSFANATCTDFVSTNLGQCDMRTTYTNAATWEDSYVADALWLEGKEPTEQDGVAEEWSR